MKGAGEEAIDGEGCLIWGKLNIRGLLEELGVNDMIILKCTLKK